MCIEDFRPHRVTEADGRLVICAAGQGTPGIVGGRDYGAVCFDLAKQAVRIGVRRKPATTLVVIDPDSQTIGPGLKERSDVIRLVSLETRIGYRRPMIEQCAVDPKRRLSFGGHAQ